MFRPTSMKRFYLAVPTEYEEKTLRRIIELGAVQLTRDIPIESTEKNETVEVCRKFVRLYERLSSTVAEVIMEKTLEEHPTEAAEASIEQIKSFVDEAETRLDTSTKQIELLETEIKNLDAARERLGFLNAHGLRIDEVGSFRHIFVKSGFLKSTVLPKLAAYVGGTSVVFVSKPGRPRENFVVIAGLNEDLHLTEMILKLLNFEEFTFPQGLNPEPKAAVQEIDNDIGLKEKEIQGSKQTLARMKTEFAAFETRVSLMLRMEEAKGLVARTKKKTLIHGWIPSDKSELLRKRLEEVVPPQEIYLRFENPNPEDKVPVEVKSKGVLGSFAMFTNLQGVPNYFEINPTPFYALLYVLMFGMMFGDMGAGTIFIVLGFVMTRLRKGFFVFSSSASRKLGQVFVFCGVSAVVFGALYGEFFLTEITHPLFLKPLDSITEISVIALVFGVAQISLAMILNTINKLRRKDSLRAVFSGHGVTGLVYYSAGIVLAVTFVNKLDFSSFLQGSVVIFTVIALISLVLIFLSPSIEKLAKRKEARLTETLIEGFGEGLETFIVLIANSVSYIRLAAFAIAHGALGFAAVIFSPVIGSLPSYIMMNVIVFLIEGFSALIQSLRLMYYEFSTKFYIDDGIQYKPFKVANVGTKI